MKRYTICHTMDELGGRYEHAVCREETDDLDQAIIEAEELTRKGFCGFVRRLSDNATLAPNGAWIDENGAELA